MPLVSSLGNLPDKALASLFSWPTGKKCKLGTARFAGFQLFQKTSLRVCKIVELGITQLLPPKLPPSKNYPQVRKQTQMSAPWSLVRARISDPAHWPFVRYPIHCLRQFWVHNSLGILLLQKEKKKKKDFTVCSKSCNEVRGKLDQVLTTQSVAN